MTDTNFPIEIDIVVEDDQWPEHLAPIADRALEEALCHVPGPQTGPVEVSLLLTNDDAQQILNTKWRHKDTTTNVLSFAAIEAFSEVTGFVGDISMARETIQAEAEDQDKDFSDHFTHLLVHGFLHCLGYDHENHADALVMENLETKILQHLGIDDPYDNQ